MKEHWSLDTGVAFKEQRTNNFTFYLKILSLTSAHNARFGSCERNLNEYFVKKKKKGISFLS